MWMGGELVSKLASQDPHSITNQKYYKNTKSRQKLRKHKFNIKTLKKKYKKK